jgi:hypothetical protein
VTSGPTTYIDERYLFCELYVDRRDIGSSDLRAGIKRFCHAIATAISALGIDARQRRGTEVEVGGRVIATAGAVLDGGAVLMQAALLMRQAPRPAQALRVFAGTLGNAAAQAAFERTAALEYLLGSNVDVPKIKHNLAEAFESDFDVEMREGDMTLSEEKRCQKALRLHQSSAFAPVLAATQADLRVLEATHACRAAVLRALILYDSDAHAVRHAWFSEGTSPRLRPETLALESALRDSPVNQVAERIRHFFSSRAVDPAIPTADDFTTVMHRAIKQPFPASSDKH